MDKREKVMTFKDELSWIQNEDIKKFCAVMISRLPDYFFVIPASSTGKYHPKYSLGDGGLVRHTKSAVLLANTLLGLEQYKNEFTQEERDIIIASLILHDGVKQGLDNIGSGHTNNMHPVDMMNYIQTYIYTKQKESKQWQDSICTCIASHMGEWNIDNKTKKEILPKPTNKLEKFVHVCDYLASRKFIEIDFEKVNY